MWRWKKSHDIPLFTNYDQIIIEECSSVLKQYKYFERASNTALLLIIFAIRSVWHSRGNLRNSPHSLTNGLGSQAGILTYITFDVTLCKCCRRYARRMLLLCRFNEDSLIQARVMRDQLHKTKPEGWTHEHCRYHQKILTWGYPINHPPPPIFPTIKSKKGVEKRKEIIKKKNIIICKRLLDRFVNHIFSLEVSNVKLSCANLDIYM